MSVANTTLADLKEAAQNLKEVNERWIITLKEVAKGKEVIQAALEKYEGIGYPDAVYFLKEDEAGVSQQSLLKSALELYSFLTLTRNLFIIEILDNLEAVKAASGKTKKGISGGAPWQNFERVNQDLIASRSRLKKFILPIIGSELTGLEFQAENLSLSVGQKQKVTVTGTFSDGTSLDLTHSVKWATNPEGIISFDKGIMTALSEGPSIVTVTWENQRSVEQICEVINNFKTTEEAPTPMQNNNQIPPFTGVTEPFGEEPAIMVEEVTFIEQIYVPVEESDPTYISEIEVYPQNITLQLGETTTFRAIVTFDDGTEMPVTDKVTWSSSDTDIIAVDDASSGPNGQVTALAPGSAQIMASLGKTNSNPATVEVPAKFVKPVRSQLVIRTGQLKMETGNTQGFLAEIVNSDGTADRADNVIWLSSDPGIMEIASNGLNGYGTATGKALKAGTAEIRAIQGQFASNKLIISISNPAAIETTGPVLTQMSLSSPQITLKPGQTYQFRAVGTQLFNGVSTMVDLTNRVNWDANNSDFVSFNPASPGLISAIKPGIANIKASLGGLNSVSGTVIVAVQPYTKISISPANPGLTKGQTLNFKAAGIFSDGTEEDITVKASWLSDNPSIMKVENNDPPNKGLAITFKAGKCKVTASFNGQSGSTDVTVKSGPGLFLQELQTIPEIAPEVITQTTRLLSNDNPNFKQGPIASQVEALLAGWKATIDQYIGNSTPSGGNPDPKKVNDMLELHSTLKTLYARLDKFAGDDVAGSSFSTY